MVEKESKHKSKDLERNSPRIQRLSAAIALPHKSRFLYTGWNEAGLPVITWDSSHLSEQASGALAEYRPIEAPKGLWRSYKDWRKKELKPVEYLGMTEPVDIKDLYRGLEKDKLNIGITTDIHGNPEMISIDELTLLDAINENLIVWQEINTDTLYKKDVIPTNLMFTLAIPHEKNGENVMLFMLFKPALENQSNEVAFQGFLMDTLKSLIYLDAQQTDSSKKGYSQAFKEIQSDLKGERVKHTSRERSANYGNGFLIVTLLNQVGLIKTPKERLNEIREASETGGLTKQLALVTLELARNAVDPGGEIVSKKRYKNTGGLDPLTVDLLRAFSLARKNAKRSFARFR